MTLFFAARAGTFLTIEEMLAELDGGLTKYVGNPVLAKGAGGTWDDYTVRELAPVIDEDGLVVTESDGIWAYYWGQDQADPGATLQIGLAKSVDGGTTWTKYGSNPLIVPGGASWYNTDVFQPATVKLDDGTRVMMAGGRNGAASTDSLGVLSSADGLTWADEGQKLTLGQFHETGTAMLEMGVPTMIKIADGTWLALFECLKDPGTAGLWRIFGATATDPTGTWTPLNSGEPLMGPTGVGWESVGVANPHVIEVTPGQYAMTYNGFQTKWQVGFAYTSTLTSWTRYSGNPILTTGAALQWDDGQVESCFLFKEPGSSLRILYHGFLASDGTAQVGLATS